MVNTVTSSSERQKYKASMWSTEVRERKSSFSSFLHCKQNRINNIESNILHWWNSPQMGI